MRIRSTIGAAFAVTALGVAGAVALPTVSSDQVLNTADETTAAPATTGDVDTDDPVAVALSLAEALQRDLGMTPEQFVSQADTAAKLGDKAGEWSKAFQDAFGGVWLNDLGEGVVGVATVFPDDGGEKKVDTKAASELRSAAKDAGFEVQDVALSQSELEQRLEEVRATIEELPQDQRDLITGVEADQNRGAVVVTTDGGTEAELGNLTAALHGLAKLKTLNAPSPTSDTSPFGSLESGQQGQGSGNETTDPGTGAVDGTGTGTAPAEQAGTEQAEQTPDATTTEADKGEAPAEGEQPTKGNSLENVLSPEALGVLSQILGMAGGADSLGSLGGANGSLGDFVPLPDPEPTPTEDAPAEDAPADPNAEAKTPADDEQVIGGTAYDAKMPIGGLECSTGFNGTLNGAPVVITAAHCNRMDGVRAALADGTEFGTFAYTKPDNIDSALIKVDKDFGERFDNNLVGGEEGKTQEITGTAAPVVGQVACKMGSRTGFSCGKIDETGTNIDVAGQRTIANAFTVDICALPGDSGGVVFSGNKALGISSASNVAGETDCAAAKTNADAAGVTPSLSVVPIDDVLAAHPGLELNTK